MDFSLDSKYLDYDGTIYDFQNLSGNPLSFEFLQFAYLKKVNIWKCANFICCIVSKCQYKCLECAHKNRH